MVDKKLTALDAITSVSSDDLIYVVDDPLVTPVSKKITVGNAFKERTGFVGAGIDEEFDTDVTGLTWTPSDPLVVDSNTTIPSHLYIKGNVATELFGFRDWSPAGAFDVRTTLSVAMLGSITIPTGNLFLVVSNSDHTKYVMLGIDKVSTTSHFFVYGGYSYDAGYTLIANFQVNGNTGYFRITRDGSNNFYYYWSTNGLVWQYLGIKALTMTVAKLGFMVYSGGAGTPNNECTSDWLRTDV